MKLSKAKIGVMAVMVVAASAGAYLVVRYRHEVKAVPEDSMQVSQQVIKKTTTAALPKAAAQDATASEIVPKVSGVPVLMYHYIGDLPANADATRKDLTVSTQNFEAQVNFLQNAGYTAITPDQLYAWLTVGTKIPAKSVVFSFDDGYADTFENAVPILEAHHMTGEFGIITGFVGTTPDFATWQQIIAARNQGMFIVSHSYSHPDFAAKSAADQDYNISKSTVDLTAELGAAPIYFIYPYGDYNSTTETVLKNHGYVMSFTTAYGFARPGEKLLELPRVRVHGAEQLQTFEDNVLGIVPKNEIPTKDQGE